MFLLVSDDMHWVKKRIFQRIKSKYDIFLAGNGRGDKIFEVGKYLELLRIINSFIKTIRKLDLNTT